MKVIIANMHPENWDTCKEGRITGLRKGAWRFKFDPGDVFLMRVTGKDYGVRGIWAFESEEPVVDKSNVPWTDAEYDLILHFSPLILEFKEEFSEEFAGASKYSEKVKINASRLFGSVVRLAESEAITYLKVLMNEKKEELKVKANYQGKEVVIYDLFEGMIFELSKGVKERLAKVTTSKVASDKSKIEDLVGDPINFRGMVYAPMNEAGVILLFSKVMNDLGIFYESTPSAGFPDMIGRRRTSKGLEKVFVEFEYKSKNFLTHKHDPKICDLVVCWEHNWPDCPVEVITLKEVIEQLRD
jgi:hypothetical protein